MAAAGDRKEIIAAAEKPPTALALCVQSPHLLTQVVPYVSGGAIKDLVTLSAPNQRPMGGTA